MKKISILPVLIIAVLLAGCEAADAPVQDEQTVLATTSAEAAFDAIKSMEGYWEGEMVVSDGRVMPTSNDFKVVSGGHTVVETLIEDGQEMVTTYTMEGGTLLTKHYCVLGTEPTFEGTLTEDGTIEFSPTSGTSYTVGEDDFVTGITFDVSEAANNTFSRTGFISIGGEDVTSEAVLTRTTKE